MFNPYDGPSTPPGRVQTFLSSPERKTLPISCTLRLWGDLGKLLEDIALDLKAGCGIKLVLDGFEKREKGKVPPIYLYLDTHIDKYMAAYMPQREEIEEGDTVIRAKDSMTGEGGIIHAWKTLINLLEEGHKNPIVIDLSELRPFGFTNDVGLIATGPIGEGEEESFFGVFLAIGKFYEKGDVASALNIFGTLNGCMRRGGVWKNGIITSSMPLSNSHINEYLNVDISTINGSHKMAVIINDQEPISDDLYRAVRDKSYFLEKSGLEVHGEENLYANVCEGIYLAPNDTCLIWRQNAGKANSWKDLIDHKEKATKDGVDFHYRWREMAEERGIDTSRYLPLEKCSQVAIDIMGFANFLSNVGVSYEAFIRDLVGFLETGKGKYAPYLAEAYENSTVIADSISRAYGYSPLSRIHTIEPAQSHSFKTTDINGNTTCRGIWPPIRRKGIRRSEAVGDSFFNHGNVEVAQELGADNYRLLCESWYLLMKKYGRPHAISYDSWHPITHDWIQQWIDGPLPTKYYTESIDQRYLQKKVQCTEERCTVCEE